METTIVKSDRFVSIRGNGFQVTLVFASNTGRDKFIERWPEIRQDLEIFRIMHDIPKPAEMSTPATERTPFVAP